MKLCLGTVQFGLDYGIANTSGKIGFEEAKTILNFAYSSGISFLDTAEGYGNSESLLGEVDVANWNVISKLSSCGNEENLSVNEVIDKFNNSLQRLKKTKIYGYLLHNASDLFSSNGKTIYTALLELKKQDLVKKIGVSIYDPKELETLTNHFELDLVQAPMNLVDRRMSEGGWLDILKKKNIEIHIRSAFLQGLLLLPENLIPKKFAKWQELWNTLEQFDNQYHIPRYQVCLGFLEQFSQIDKIVVGIDSLAQLKELIVNRMGDLENFPEVSSSDPDLINPFMWSKL